MDFANTRYKPGAEWRDTLDRWAAVETWARRCGIEVAAGALSERAGDGALAEVRSLRDDWRLQLGRLVDGQPVEPAFLERLNAVLAGDCYSERIEAQADGGYRRARTEAEAGGSVLLALARAIVAFLTERELQQLRRCANPECVLFFYDTSKNHRRQWCSQQGCGNRAKVAAFRARRAGRIGGRGRPAKNPPAGGGSKA